MRIAVIGAGIGGLACAIRLSAAGHQVEVLESHRTPGGKLGEYRRDGFVFDLGPSLLTRPALLVDTLALGGISIDDALIRLPTTCRYFFADGTTVDYIDDPATTKKALRSEAIADGYELDRHYRFVDRQWQLAKQFFVSRPLDLAGVSHDLALHPVSLTRLEVRRTVAQYASQEFRDPRAQQLTMRYATYSGSSPFLAPGVLTSAEGLERSEGSWYVSGGLGRIVDALLEAASNLGVVIHLSTPIERVRQEGQLFGLSPHTDVTYDKIIFNCDPRVAQRLLPGAVDRLSRRAQLSTSGVVINVGKTRAPTTPLLSHHNVFFAPSYRDEYRGISAGGAGSNPTVYLCASSVTDATQAPSGGQNWFVLINTAANTQLDTDDAVAACESTLNSHNLSLYDDAAFVDIRDPAELAHRTSTPNGAIYGTSSDGYSAALVRQANRGRIAGTYFVGGGAHPGGGIPLVLSSAEIVADLIERDRSSQT